MEFLPGGDLHNYLINPENTLTIEQALEMSIQVTEGMTYLAKLRIVHRDLAARNCMLAGKTVKITDFGLCRKLTLSDYYPQTPQNAHTGLPFPWTALECLNFTGKFTEKSDVWSFGVLLFEIFSRKQRPYNFGPLAIRDFLMSGKRLGQPGQCPIKVYEVMKICWLKDWNERPKFEELYGKLKELLDEMRNEGNEEVIETGYLRLVPRLHTQILVPILVG